MSEAPAFFVPRASDDAAEAAYGELARFCGRTALPARERIYSIVYVHDGEEWTATVGRQLSGVKRWTTRSRGRKIDHVEHPTDSATVLAIFPGVPFMVVTDARMVPGIRSYWENPFMVGKPRSIDLFEVTE